MNLIPAYLRKIGRTLLAVLVLCCSFASCDSVINDYEGDCSVVYRIAFRYELNMKWADAFAHEVHSVHLYAFDQKGVLVWQKAEKGEVLARENYSMNMELPAGKYKLLAWCGLDNDANQDETFTVPDAQVGKTRIEELQCTMKRQYDAALGGAYSKKKLYPLFHGMLDVELPSNEDGGEYNYTMFLTKDTNHVRIILQHLSGKPVNEKDFTFRIEEENGLMNFDNELLPDEKITYWAHDVKSGTASLGMDDYPVMPNQEQAMLTAADTRQAVTSVSVAIADLTIARLMDGRKTILTVADKDGDIVARIPLTDYALLLKDGYDYPMDNQEYLDRQDEYALTFFLDENRIWIGTSIIINSWRLVLSDVDFD